jgi:hypothetical protein
MGGAEKQVDTPPRRGSKTRFIAISTTSQGVQPYLENYPLPFLAYIVEDRRELERLHIAGTPQTIEIDGNGLVTGNWLGIYDGETASSLDERFHVALPHRAEGLR